MTHMTVTSKATALRRRSLEHGVAMQPMGMPSATSGSDVSRAFTLRIDCIARGGNVASRVFPKGDDS